MRQAVKVLLSLMSTRSLERSLEIAKICQEMLSREPHMHSVLAISSGDRILKSKLRSDSAITNLTRNEIEML